MKTKKDYTRKELNEIVRNHTNDQKTYFQKWKNEDTIIFGVWLTSEDAMDNAGEIKITTN
jgi:hypothetical protein